MKKTKKLWVLGLIMGCMLVFGTAAHAATLNLTLYFDWDGSGFSSTPLAITTPGFTFQSGSGATGEVKLLGGCIALVYHTGCAPMYAGPLYGFMKCTDGSQGATTEPGRWYLGPAVTADLLVKGDKADDGSSY